MIDYSPPKKTLTGQYYAELTCKSRDAIKQKCHGKLSLGVWLLHNSAPVHRSLVAQQAVHDCGFVKLNHPTYCLDLATSDYYLFRNLKYRVPTVRESQGILRESGENREGQGKVGEF